MSSHANSSNPARPSSSQPIGLGIVGIDSEEVYIPRASMLPADEYAYLKKQHELAQQACKDEPLREKHRRLSQKADEEHKLIVNQVKMRSMNVPNATDDRWLDPHFDPDELPEYLSEHFPTHLPPDKQEHYNQRAHEDDRKFDSGYYQDDMTETSSATWRTHGTVDEVLATRLAYLARYGQRLSSGTDPTFMALTDPPVKQEVKAKVQEEVVQDVEKEETPSQDLNKPHSPLPVHKPAKLRKPLPGSKRTPTTRLSIDSSLDSFYEQPTSAFSDDTIASPFSPLSPIVGLAKGLKRKMNSSP
ncbi:uncharacterized protein BDZ99DRAFT_481658 [Mytilinidion resinicola]|uniref:Uncharacterized protein n=1 Tax=Mytilinidion resinicola TaxID=574789 RepID=A0A6A6Y8F3_9PEZI|nr:uncharacterized protein BDZ99DRAFT_481658 [Mytilinidion resinicola]KAF2804097.1 hypothetical protein BDZ99DRAFT_481658 [Mytilinidion resinicola]